jgi:hypothetical protein
MPSDIKYHSVPDGEGLSSDAFGEAAPFKRFGREPDAKSPSYRQNVRVNRLMLISLVLSNLILAGISAALWVRLNSMNDGVYRTDFADARKAITYEERVFSGALKYNTETKDVFRDIDPSEPQYFGPPSPDVDAAWDKLLAGMKV